MRELSLILALGASEPRALSERARVDVAFEVVEASIERLASDRAPEIVLAGVAGEIRSLRLERDATGAIAARGPLGTLTLADPRRCAIAWAPLERGGAAKLFVASPRGVELYDAAPDGGFAAGTTIAPRAKLLLRTGQPTLAPLATDVNGDGRTDLVVPSGEKLDVWLRANGDALAFTRAVSVRVPRTASRSTDAGELSDVLQSSLRIPGLSMRDVDGDGRADLLVEDGMRRAFHRVRQSGEIPESPDVELDLSIFRDTTPEAELVPGRVLAGGGVARYQSRDLDGDGIPDAVIAHRRKVWVFRASRNGPQFTEPSAILKTDEDVTALVLASLDDDALPDLVLIKVQVPTIGEILRGLVAELTIDVNALGYRNVGEGRFDPKPAWRSTLELRVPAILSLIKAPETWIQRLEDAGKRFRRSIEADFDGDGARDVALVAVDGGAIEVWRGASAGSNPASESDRMLRSILFDDENREWDFDRLVEWLATLGEQRARTITGARTADARASLRDPKAWRLDGILTGDVDGARGDEIVLRWTPLEPKPDGPRAAFDVLGW